ncbi:putative tRNA (cytosine(34)-C(5))-methyltransferase [Cocos nucifera]|uniref:Putative tRNA (Cytosine(34)-C(5))-methyltransferase n=1 Tax=Cocos nucifera TaxID=13894 RepID=A0A8K0N1C3_COCNU|nr:putative tRNA (cytosine(34)-C(5))-methyltransferase [Cocos nucifera]
MYSANLIVTNHEAQHFPSCSLTRNRVETFKEGQEELGANVLQFDCVLCDVPCSGDGTLRMQEWETAFIVSKWSSLCIALLKVGGRMVYSTCSMNPVKDKGLWLASYKDVPIYRRGVILPSMFPSGQSCKECPVSCDDAVEVWTDTGESANKFEGVSSKRSPAAGELDGDSKVEVSSFPLEHCVKILPHDQSSGAFFIAVLQKISPLHGNQTAENIVADASTIAIVCRKGKTNLSIMVSPLDAKELLERLAVHFGSERGTLLKENEDTISKIGIVKN